MMLKKYHEFARNPKNDYQYLFHKIAITFTSMHPKADSRFLLRMRKMEYKPLSQTRKARR